MIGESLLQGLRAACREDPQIPGSEETKRAEQGRSNVTMSLLVHASKDLTSFLKLLCLKVSRGPNNA